MAIIRVTVLQRALVSVWLLSGQFAIASGSETPGTPSTGTSLQPSSQIHFTDSNVHTTTAVIQSTITEQTKDDSSPSEIQDLSSTLTSSKLATTNISSSKPTVETAALDSSPVSVTTVQHVTSTNDTRSLSTEPPMNANTSQLSQGIYTSFPSTTIVESAGNYSLEFTDSQNDQETASVMMPNATSSSTLVESRLTVAELATHSMSLSSAPESEFSDAMTQSTSLQEIQPTSAVGILPTAVPITTWSATATVSATSTPTSTSQTPSRPVPSGEHIKMVSSGAMSMGTKVIVGVTVSLCIMGVIIAGVFVYQRYFTHRSLKSFLTSGVRYKTYNNATYKDDEGMLIMPDRSS